MADNAPSVITGTDAKIFGTSSSSPETLSYNSGMSGSDRCLMVMVGAELGKNGVSAISYGGNALTLLDANENTVNTGSFMEEMFIYYLLDPPTGANTFSLSFNSDGQDWSAQLVTLENVNQSTPFGTPTNELYFEPDTSADTDITTTDTNSSLFVGGVVNGVGCAPFTAVTDTTIINQDAHSASSSLGFAFYMAIREALATTGTYTVGATSSAATAGNPSDTVVIGVEVFGTSGGSVTATPNALDCVTVLDVPSVAVQYSAAPDSLDSLTVIESPAGSITWSLSPDPIESLTVLDQPVGSISWQGTPDVLGCLTVLDAPTYSYTAPASGATPDALESVSVLESPGVSVQYIGSPDTLFSLSSLDSISSQVGYTGSPASLVSLTELEAPSYAVSWSGSPEQLVTLSEISSPSVQVQYVVSPDEVISITVLDQITGIQPGDASQAILSAEEQYAITLTNYKPYSVELTCQEQYNISLSNRKQYSISLAEIEPYQITLTTQEVIQNG